MTLARGWRTDLPRVILLLQAGNAVNFFGYGLIIPFEISLIRARAAQNLGLGWVALAAARPLVFGLRC